MFVLFVLFLSLLLPEIHALGLVQRPADCPPSHFVCNGQCVSSPCPSASARSSRFIKRKFLCPGGQTACTVPGRGATSWECIDTKSDLESCGGCVLSAFNPPGQQQGRDCTDIPGVFDVSCVEGHCIVDRCMPGFEVSSDGSLCLPRSVDHDQTKLW